MEFATVRQVRPGDREFEWISKKILTSRLPSRGPFRPILAQSEAQRIRRRYIRHEAAIRTIGLFYCVAGWLMILGLAVTVVSFSFSAGRWDGLKILLLILAMGLTGIVFALGSGLRRLESGARVMAIVIAGLGVAASLVAAILTGNPIPLGELPFDLMVLYLVASSNNSIVFSNTYRAARQATPEIPYPAAPVLLTFLVLLISVAGPLILASLLQPELLHPKQLLAPAPAEQHEIAN